MRSQAAIESPDLILPETLGDGGGHDGSAGQGDLLFPVRRTDTLSGLLSAIPSILIGMDNDDVVTQWNAAAVKAFGVTAEQAIDRASVDCPIAWDWKVIKQDLEKSRDCDAQLRFDDVRFVRPSGEEGFLGITINPMRNELG